MSIPKKLTIKQALSRAKKAVKQGDISLAQQLYNLILKYDPQHPIAIKELRKLKEIIPPSVELYSTCKSARKPNQQID